MRFQRGLSEEERQKQWVLYTSEHRPEVLELLVQGRALHGVRVALEMRRHRVCEEYYTLAERVFGDGRRAQRERIEGKIISRYWRLMGPYNKVVNQLNRLGYKFDSLDDSCHLWHLK